MEVTESRTGYATTLRIVGRVDSSVSKRWNRKCTICFAATISRRRSAPA